ncbi:MAG: hypothetical protein JJ971_09000 [Balneolaceae bacterium]|nr:hypothetical protein [Balneolaceae bacterium]MBO6546621.1 hypothetical protein [Balneolaceae bacterium]MBO6648979.1 hypothetical protein [Balneolaceae bacterium]
MKTLLACFFIILLGAFPVQSQEHEPSEERSSFERRKTSTMDGNLLRATYHNTGHAGRRNSSSLDELIFEYPRNTNREYMYFMSVMFGTEVPDNSTPEDDVFPIVDVASYKTSRDGRTNWSLNPIVGYVRDDSDEMARSDRGPTSPLGNTWPDTWPDKFENGGDGWAGSWNGFFGRDQFNADVEFYYKAGDDTYIRYVSRFQPDETDPSRGGLGIILDTRILAWSQTLVNATHFNLFEITNDGSYDYPRMAFGLWIADFVGGGGPTDEPVFDNIRSIAYLTDTDRQSGGSAFDGGLIGEMGLKFLETPGNAIDGIDNDGDSDTYNPLPVPAEPIRQARYEVDNKDLFTPLTSNGGGFYAYETLRDTVIKPFVAEDFEERTINQGDKIVLIQNDNSRIIATYDGSPFISQGVTYDFEGAASFSAFEDILPQTDEDFGIHIDGIDNDFDGLIDENQPNHLTKSTFINGVAQVLSVRFINYLNFEPGDTLQSGLIVSNQEIRDRMNNDPSFEELVNVAHNGRFKNHFTSAPMIDEARDDFFDNDDDWNVLIDDVGIEGDPETPSQGQNDGFPTSGAGTSFPGESSIDKTDVSETDLIGVSRVRIFDAGALQVDQDANIWLTYLIPGTFVEEVGTDSDIFVSSGLFPLAKGASERFAVAITAAQENGTPTADRQKINERLDDATTAYEADYQFAVAPTPPILSAVPSNGKVTLYWDASSEESFDRYINLQTGDGFDFEGYKIYRTTDVSFQDIFDITDATGSPLYLRPIAIIDKDNGISGFHPVATNGTQFNLGNDTGLKRFFEDTDVINGRKYYYAVTAYDRGFEAGGISPSESPVQISLNPDGTVTFGQNVIEVRPSKDIAGYISPENPMASLASGAPGGTVQVEILDPSVLKPENIYDVVFEDTLVSGGADPDTIKTQSFTLRNVTGGVLDTLISRSSNFNGENNPNTEGFTITLNNVNEFGLNETLSGWKFDHELTPHQFVFVTQSAPKVADYDIVIGDNVGFGQSTEKEIEVSPGSFQVLPSVETNFKVFNTLEGNEIKYAFFDLNNPSSAQQRCNPTFFPPDNYENPAPGQLSAVSGFSGRCSDIIYFIEDYRGVEDTTTFRVSFSAQNVDGALVSSHPQSGDTLQIFTNKPFTENDRFVFMFDENNIPRIDADTARSELDDILVIPNPYKVSNIFEGATTNTNLQQNRELHFTGIPAPSTLRIFTVSGVLVREIDIQPNDLTSEYGGSYIWNMLTKDNLEISYGIYLYHIEAPGIGEKVGKFAVIK